MTEAARLKAVPAAEDAWCSSSHEVVIGKDILELLSTSMYVDPMTIYREYVQNAADSIDEAREQRLLHPTDGRIEIAIDPNARSIRIRDDGTSIPWPEFVERLSNLGASRKRGTVARGFRGVGRLSGLGYCQELVFRGRAKGDSHISELRWDGRALKAALRASDQNKNLRNLVKEVISVRRLRPQNEPSRFFEVELVGVVRHRDDRLLSDTAVADYLSQVAPVPFSGDFKFAEQIATALKLHVRLGDVAIYLNDSEHPLSRPHRNRVETNGKVEATFESVEIIQFRGVDTDMAAIGWFVHHEYSGALPNRALVKGVRLRSGNIQVGDHDILEGLFPEPRFNSWSVGEIHVLDPRILANGRRDHFEHSVHLDNVLNQLGPVARDIARRCRLSSVSRKWHREFELHRDSAIERARTVSRGGMTRVARQTHVDATISSLKNMGKVLQTRHIDDQLRRELAGQAMAVEAKVHRMLGEDKAASDPLDALPKPKQTAYRHIISLIYECSANRVAAGALVERLIARLAKDFSPGVPQRKTPKAKSRPAKGAKRKS
jgi:molecular chaperone HtpG